MKRLLLQSVLLLIFFNSYSQESQTDDWCTPGTKTYNEKFDKIVGMYSAMLESEKSQEYTRLLNEVIEKSDFVNSGGNIDPKDLDQWIMDNISKTKFTDKAAAEALMLKRNTTYKEVIMANVEMYKVLQESVRRCGKDFLQAVYFEMLMKYGDGFHP